MPRRCPAPALLPTLQAQDQVISREQALEVGLTPYAIGHRTRFGLWRSLLPAVYFTHQGEPTRRQRLIAGTLYAGGEAAIDGVDACRFYGMQAVAVDDELVHLLVPHTSPARSRGFVVVRRTERPFASVSTGVLRYVDPATALVAATRDMRSERRILAAASDALQRNIVTLPELVRAHRHGPRRGALLLDAVLAQLGVGVLSVPEADFAALVAASSVLPPAEYNVRLRLPGGRIVCADALFRTSAVVHETNGRSAHRREDLFEDMQERHSVLTAAGFVVLHNPPSRIRTSGAAVIAEVERCHQRYDGRGLPPGVTALSGVG